MAEDKFVSVRKGLESPADEHFIITPDDDNDAPVIPRVILVESDGDITIRDKNGNDITYSRKSGDMLLFRGRRILATGTTVTKIIGWV